MSGFANRGPQDNTVNSSYPAGPQLFDPSIAASGGGRSYAGSVTARAGGGRASATKLAAAVNRITTCATAADSVALPPAVGGQVVYLSNVGAAACQVFADAATSDTTVRFDDALHEFDTINGVAAATGVSLAVGKSASVSSAGPGIWNWVLSA